MNISFLDLKRNYDSIKDEIQIEMNKVLNKCNYIHGEEVTEFENNFAHYIGTKHFIGCGNGTDALELAIESLDLKETDEIIVQGNTYIATCSSVLRNKHKLVLCDVEKNTIFLDFNDLEKKITPNTKVLIVVHLNGLVQNMDKITEICKTHNLILMEDCAQAHGAKWKGQSVGSFGTLSCFSFYPGKNLGAYGDGGGIGTNDDNLMMKIRKLTNLGCRVKYHHEMIGRNSRLDTLQASILNVKLKHLDNWNEKRRQVALWYKKGLLGNIHCDIIEPLPHTQNVYHLYVIRVNNREELQKYLKEKGIQTLVHYPISIAETDAMKHLQFQNVFHCIQNSEMILSLPIYPEITKDEVDYVCQSIQEFYKPLTKLKTFEVLDKPGILSTLNEMNIETKRLFFIDSFENINKDNNTRGKHVNKNCDEIMILLKGHVELMLRDDEKNEFHFSLQKNDTIKIPRGYYLEFYIQTPDTQICVLTNEIYSKTKSI